jgi:hypothetical protein
MKNFLKLLLIFFLGISNLILAVVPLSVVDKEIDDAQKEFDVAKKMFNPWYSGPLLTGSPHTLPPGMVNLQPYLFITNNHGAYSGSGSSSSVPNKFVVKPLIDIQTGLTKNMDITLEVKGFYKKKQGHSYFGYGDTSLSIAYALIHEKPYVPAMKIYLHESFPTGKFQKFSENKKDISDIGSGSFETSFGLNIGKVIWWWLTHPINLRLSSNFNFPANVHVRGYNTYGGGNGTRGTVKPGCTISFDYGTEISITKKIVLALDIEYDHANKTTFSGVLGTLSDGSAASVGNPSSENLSIAPALEYNFNENSALIAGVWFSVWGRNSSNFLSGILSYTVAF